MRRAICSVDDLTIEEIGAVLERAAAMAKGGPPAVTAPRLVGLAFLTASLRTRIGFSAAAARLGWSTVAVDAPRSGPTSMAESWDDTLRTLGGMVDLVVARPGRPLAQAEVAATCAVPFINGGDEGPTAEHPSQALVDMFAIEHLRGPVGDQVVALCGDLRMRAVRSLVRLLCRRPPRRLVLVSSPPLAYPEALPPALAAIAEQRTLNELRGVDVVYLAGIPHGAADESDRAALRFGTGALAALATDAIVLSPLPLLDEITPDARFDQRVRMFDQSDLGVAVRAALLLQLVGAAGAVRY